MNEEELDEKFSVEIDLQNAKKRIQMLERDLKMYRDIIEKQFEMLRYCEKCGALINLKK